MSTRLFQLLRQAGARGNVEIEERGAGSGIDLARILSNMLAPPGQASGPVLLTCENADGTTGLVFMLNTSTLNGGHVLGPACFSPGILGELILWLDAASEQNADDEAAISNWDDKGPLDNDAIQNTGANQPTWETGQDAVQFDGTNDYMNVDGVTLDPATDTFTIAALVKADASAAMDIVSQRDGTGTGRVLLGRDLTDHYDSDLGGSTLTTTGTYATGQWDVVLLEWDGTTNKIRVNSAEDASGARTGEAADGGWRVAASKTPGDYWSGYIKCLLVFSPKISDTARDLLETWLTNKATETFDNLSVTSPTAADAWTPGDTETITWSKGSGISSVKIELSTDGGGTWSTIATGQTGSSYSWSPIPAQGVLGNQDAIIRISDEGGPAVAESDQFTLYGSLMTAMVTYYRLPEPGGTRIDSHGSNNLTPTNAPGNRTGKIGDGVLLDRAKQQYLEAPDSASLSRGNTDFTWAFWVKMNSKTGTQDPISKDRSSDSNEEHRVDYVDTSDRFRWTVSNDGSANTTVVANNLGSPSTGVWYFIVVWHDAAGDTINIQVNNGTADSAAHSTGIFDSAAPFRIGKRVSGVAGGGWFDGIVDEVGLWGKVLTAAEKTALYNSGNGRTYPFLED